MTELQWSRRTALATAVVIGLFTYVFFVQGEVSATEKLSREREAVLVDLLRAQKIAQNLNDYRREGQAIRQEISAAEHRWKLLREVDEAGSFKTLLVTARCDSCRLEPFVARLRKRFSVAELVTKDEAEFIVRLRR